MLESANIEALIEKGVKAYLSVSTSEERAELAVEFVLPLLGQLAGTDDKAALQVVTHDQFLDEQSSGLRFGVFGSNSSIRGFTPAIWHAM